MRFRGFGLALLSSAAVVGLSAGAGAQTETASAAGAAVETVIVTAAKTADAAKGGTPLIETPQNIQILSHELLTDQGAHLLDDALRNVAGVMPGGYYNGWDYFRIRGFDASGFLYQDGLLYDIGVQPNAELFGLEQVEIVKGPSSSLFGQGSLGGLVNLVSKHPKPDTFMELGASVASYDSWEVTADGGTALNDSGTVYGRLVGAWRHDGIFTEYADGTKRFYAAPSVTWEIDDATTLTLLSSYQHDKYSLGFPLPALGTVTASKVGYIPLDRFTGQPGRSNTLEQTRAQVGYEFEHRFNGMFTLHQNARYSYSDGTWNDLLYPAALEADQRTLELYPYGARGHWTNINVDTTLKAEFDTGVLSHTLIAGIDIYHNNYWWVSQQIDYSDYPGSYIMLDLYKPVYGAAIPSYAVTDPTHQYISFAGVYVQDHIKLDRFTLTVGGRYDNAREHDFDTGLLTSDRSDSKFVPRVGATYEIVPGALAYASYSESFSPQYAKLFTGGVVPPETGDQYEAGVKTNLLDGRINATASIYQLTRQNVATDDPLHAGFSIVTGEQRSRGFELDSQIVIQDGWELIAAYAYTDAKITKDNTYKVGAMTRNVPPQSLSLWTKYEFQDGDLKGLGFSIGGSAYSHQSGQDPSQDGTIPTFYLPGYLLVNGNVSYDFGNFSAQFNVKNITNERYFIGSYNDLYVQPGGPRNYRLSLTWKM